MATRRNALTLGLFGCTYLLFGCGPMVEFGSHAAASPGSGPTPAPVGTPTPSPSVPQAWNVNPWTYFVASAGTTFDLSPTLPSGVKRGGSFGVDPRGTPLPSGMTLTPAGQLSVGSAGVSQTAGVLFTYAEPA
jgi:hypothetical protein